MSVVSYLKLSPKKEFLKQFEGEMEELAKLVKKKIERLHRRYGLGRISIIGHSKGGLIGYYYIKKLGGAKRVRGLITLGTPHYGNPWALLGRSSLPQRSQSAFWRAKS